MQERYRLLHLTAPAVEELEASIRKLREVIAAHKETIAEKEAEIGCNNPAVFKTLQVEKEMHRRATRFCAILKRRIPRNCYPDAVCRPRTAELRGNRAIAGGHLHWRAEDRPDDFISFRHVPALKTWLSPAGLLACGG